MAVADRVSIAGTRTLKNGSATVLELKVLENVMNFSEGNRVRRLKM